MAVKPIPEGYHSITPYLTVQGVSQMIDFLKQAFDAQEIHRLAGPDGKIMHAEIRIGDSPVMLGEARGEWKPTPTTLYLYVQDADAVYQRAVKAGSASLHAPTDQFYGDRTAAVTDSSGNMWHIATRIENLSQEEVVRRAAQLK
jgi:PhnB protein